MRLPCENGKERVVDMVTSEANNCLKAGDGMNFENKVVLAIATRLAAERFMVNRINDNAFVAAIKSNQTQALLAKFKKTFPGETATIQTLQRVVLMTPENIHLNSFMYEPIIDMSDEHLRKLYQDVCSLK